MAYKAVHRHAQIGARKVRRLADLIRGQKADKALEILKYEPHRGARMLEKVLRSAMANAEDRRAQNLKKLTVIEARVDEGPFFKRMRPHARGMASMFKKRTSHIHVALE